jgi:hypothetical protein
LAKALAGGNFDGVRQGTPFSFRFLASISGMLLASLFLTPASGAEPRLFHGVLSSELNAEPGGVFEGWGRGAEEDLKRFGLEKTVVKDLHVGSFSFGDAPELKFPGAIVSLNDGRILLYVGLNQSGKMSDTDVVPFEMSPPGAYYSAQARFAAPLKNSPFKSLPVLVRIPRDTSAFPAAADQLVIIYTARAFVEGKVQLPHRSMLVRYQYDLNKKTVDLTTALEWFDINGDGKIDPSPRSRERGLPAPDPPIFHVGQLWLQTESVDLPSLSFTLKAVDGD